MSAGNRPAKPWRNTWKPKTPARNRCPRTGGPLARDALRFIREELVNSIGGEDLTHDEGREPVAGGEVLRMACLHHHALGDPLHHVGEDTGGHLFHKPGQGTDLSTQHETVRVERRDGSGKCLAKHIRSIM